MPWITDDKGNKSYKVSLYTKNELPTWNEVYNEYWLKTINIYIPDSSDPDMHIEDPYWKIPRRIVLLAMIANQLNKMLFEDNMHKHILEELNQDRGEWGDFEDIRFLIEPLPELAEKLVVAHNEQEGEQIYAEHVNVWNEFMNKKFVALNCAPPIYTIPNPNGTPDHFITNEHPRIDVTTIRSTLMLYPILQSKSKGESWRNIEAFYPNDMDPYMSSMYQKIMKLMMDQYAEYFENGVGWKDENGNLITDQQPPRRDPQARDPAL